MQASWTQPNATCEDGEATYSAFWVGLGGTGSNSDALEQIGTELDCSASGAATSSAWSEVVPSPAKSVRMTAESGDEMSASVVVSGHRVMLQLTDRTRHESFSKQITASSVDTSSAEWIAEAPSACTTSGFCETLPLTNFGSMRFTAARARITTGRHGPISGPAWNTNRIVLSSGGRTFVEHGNASQSTPSALDRSGTSFQVSYSQAQAAPSPPRFHPRDRRAGHASYAVQPGGKLG